MLLGNSNVYLSKFTRDTILEKVRSGEDAGTRTHVSKRETIGKWLFFFAVWPKTARTTNADISVRDERMQNTAVIIWSSLGLVQNSSDPEDFHDKFNRRGDMLKILCEKIVLLGEIFFMWEELYTVL